MNSSISVHKFQSQGVVLFMGEETDDSATTKWSRSLGQCHWQAADLLALRTQKNIPKQCDLDFCARLAVLLKLQRIILHGQRPGAVLARVRESEQMNRPRAEWCGRVPSLSYFLR